MFLGYFSGFGYSCPTNFNPSDYVMTLSQVETFESLEASGLLKVFYLHVVNILVYFITLTNCKHTYLIYIRVYA